MTMTDPPFVIVVCRGGEYVSECVDDLEEVDEEECSNSDDLDWDEGERCVNIHLGA